MRCHRSITVKEANGGSSGFAATFVGLVNNAEAAAADLI